MSNFKIELECPCCLETYTDINDIVINPMCPHAICKNCYDGMLNLRGNPNTNIYGQRATHMSRGTSNPFNGKALKCPICREPFIQPSLLKTTYSIGLAITREIQPRERGTTFLGHQRESIDEAVERIGRQNRRRQPRQNQGARRRPETVQTQRGTNIVFTGEIDDLTLNNLNENIENEPPNVELVQPADLLEAPRVIIHNNPHITNPDDIHHPSNTPQNTVGYSNRELQERIGLRMDAAAGGALNLAQVLDQFEARELERIEAISVADQELETRVEEIRSQTAPSQPAPPPAGRIALTPPPDYPNPNGDFGFGEQQRPRCLTRNCNTPRGTQRKCPNHSGVPCCRDCSTCFICKGVLSRVPYLNAEYPTYNYHPHH